MKNLLILIFALSAPDLSAQPYESLFGANSTQWNITIGNLWGSDTDQHIVTGDTTINGLPYKIIEGYSSEGYKGYIREDVSTGKAWYRTNKDSEEYLFLDLNLEVGETFYIGGNWNPSPGNYTVDSVYILNGRKHIRFNFPIFFQSLKKFTMIEGISSTLGFRYQDMTYINNFNPDLLCSYKDDVKIYGEAPCIVSTVGINDPIAKAEVKIYPNPAVDKLVVKIENSPGEKFNCSLVNVSGQTIFSRSISGGEAHGMDISEAGAGSFIILIRDAKGKLIAEEKLIIHPR